jgi:SGNH domain (fused to AT3 domains)
MRPSRSTFRLLLGALLLAAVAAGAALGAPGPGARCYGAASRDREHPCFNAALLKVVRPRPVTALLETDAPCDPFDRGTTISICWFGVGGTVAPPSIAIIGDSHATHWRPAVNVLARAKGWRGASLARTSCPFTLGVSASLSPALRRSCIRHNHAIPGWLAAHPGIQTVFVAGNAGARVLASGGRSQFAATVAGDVAALKSLPLSVRHVIVIRDAVKSTYQTPSCVRRAIKRHLQAGRVCAVPLARVLHPDPLVLAARSIGTRVQVIDLKRFQCGAHRCFPVVGGVLVHQDIDHLTREFATTLGPYLLRAFNRLAARWPRPAGTRAAALPPACLGAAARDPEQPCSNPALRRSVTPTPDQALLELDSPCAREGATGVLGLCGFGTPEASATETVALLGDSHATHWRPALNVAAQARGWHVENITRTSCPFSTAPIDKARALRRACLQRNREAAAWLRAHPQVSTVFVAGNAGVRVYRTKPRNRFRRALAGYRAAFATLPPSVRHVVVIRDSVKSTTGTNDCVRRAMRARRRAGIVCAQPRALLRRDDAAAAAARALGAPRGAVIDLTSFQCSRRYCFPVVGGVLVHKDIDHITRLFATTLGPYLLRAYDRLAAGWPAG